MFRWMKRTTTSKKYKCLWDMKRKRGKEQHTFGSTNKANHIDSQTFMLLMDEKF